MTDELAQELKAAGFTQYGNGEFEQARKPDLHELLDACGPHIYALQTIVNHKHPAHVVGWFARTNACPELDDLVWYATPEEAVARFWLELYKKL